MTHQSDSKSDSISGSIPDQLEAFARDNQELLERGKLLLAQLEKPGSSCHVHKPLLLKLILEKYLELIEERLLPELPRQLTSSPQAAPSSSSSAEDNCNNTYIPGSARGKAADQVGRSNPCEQVENPHTCSPHLIDDFRATNPRYRPINRKPQRVQPTVSRTAPQPRTGRMLSASSNVRVELVSSSETRPARPIASPAARLNPIQKSQTAAATNKTPGELPHIIGKDGANTHESHPTSKRTTPRYACHMPVNYFQEGADKTSLKAYSKDIAALGLYILSNRPQKTGDKLKIEVEMPNHQKAVLQAVVRWTHWVPQNLRSLETPGFGVKITNAPEAWYTYFMNEPKPAQAHL